ncbi:MAG: hypothetical protein ABEJ05_01515 [Haloglomus sp.]
MKLPNRDGVGVDPVPFVVVAGFLFLFAYSYLPLCLVGYGLSVPEAVLASTTAWAPASLFAYHRLVWTYRPERREHVPPDLRLLRLGYATLAGVALLALLALPLFVR